MTGPVIGPAIGPIVGPVPGLPPVVRLGTRRSALALAQSGQVAEQVAALGVRVELVPLTTEGDTSTAPLASLGGVGVFVSRLRRALVDGEVDLAVHSLKDLPTAPFPAVTLAAVPPREDPRDVLVARDGLRLDDLPPGARVGTGSPRRAAQLRHRARAVGRPVEVVDLRGNVDTRLARVGTDLDAVVLARAGLLRLGRAGEATEVLDTAVMLPAPGQGALALECRSTDHALIDLLKPLDDNDSRACVAAERALLARLEAGCSAPVGALAEVAGGALQLRAVMADDAQGLVLVHRAASGRPDAAERLGERLADELLGQGAGAVAAAPVREMR